MCVHAHVCICQFFPEKKSSPRKLLTGLLPNFIVVFVTSNIVDRG